MNVVASIDSETQLTLAQQWQGGALDGEPYRLRYMSDGSRSSAQARQLINMLGGSGNLEALGGLAGLPDTIPVFTGPGTMSLVSRSDLVSGVDYDVQIDTLPDRDAYDAQPEGFSVLVGDAGDGRSAIYSRVGAAGNWTAAAYVTGPQGQVGPYTNVTFGPVTTVSPGTPASADVTQVDDETVRVDLSIPRGQDGTGTGDVTGPSGATDGHVVLFDGVTGKLIKSSEKSIDDIGSVDELFDGPLVKSPTEQAQARGNIGLGNSATRNVGTTAGTVAAGNDARFIDNPYGRSNIVGPVSQSGGIPTGAVVERGSNANGEYVRYADGTQICWPLEGTITITSDFAIATFPAAFASVPMVVAASIVGAPAFRVISNNIPTTTSVGLQCTNSNNQRIASTATWTATGRWF